MVIVYFSAITKSARLAGGLLPVDGIMMEDEPVMYKTPGDKESEGVSCVDQSVEQLTRSAVVQLRTSLQVDQVRQRLLQEKLLMISSTSRTSIQVYYIIMKIFIVIRGFLW